MSDQAKDLVQYISKIASQDSSLPITVPTAIRLSKSLVKNSIKELLAIDEQMCDLCTSRFASLDDKEVARLKWQETFWHQVLKTRIENLRKVLEELN